MAKITASMVKELRDKTGAGMMDCKAALTESEGDFDAAVDWLRKKGLAKAAKKAGRVAADGLIGLKVAGDKAALIEVNSETDFVARNETFQDMVLQICDVALDADGDLDALSNAKFPGGDISVAEHIREMVGSIGENMSLRRSTGLSVGKGVIGSYMHGAVKPGLGKIGVIVALESDGDREALGELGRQLAMHIAAASPLAVTADELDRDVIAKERAVYEEQARQSGKPDNIVEKMAEGRLRKEFFQQVVLMQQIFVIDGKDTVEKALKAAEDKVGAPVKVAAFERFALGEGIEKEESDFAAEVAAATSTN